MISTDEEALICDLAETYHIYEYRSLPCRKVAIFSCGLRNDSRIKMKIAQVNITPEQMMLAAIADSTRMTAWLHTKDAEEGTNRPKSLLGVLIGEREEKAVIAFDSGEEFREAWRRMTRKEVE